MRTEADKREKYNDDLVRVSGEKLFANIDLLAIHLRDARNLYDRGADQYPVFAKGAILLACAALEGHLTYWRDLGLAWNDVASASSLNRVELEHLREQKEIIDDRGEIKIRAIRLSLETKLVQIPTLLCRLAGRAFILDQSTIEWKKLLNAIRRRDAIIHPRCDRYLKDVSITEAGEAIDAVELYLANVQHALFPYLAGYFALLYRTPPGRHKHDGVEVGYRTPKDQLCILAFTSVPEVGLSEALVGHWFEADLLANFALVSQAEGYSKGSMLTRLALVIVVAMLSIELSIIAQVEMQRGCDFQEVELMYLNEYAIGMDETGTLFLDDDRQSFKQRLIAIPKILARRVAGKPYEVSLGDASGEQLLAAEKLRERIMHSHMGVPVPRIPKEDLIVAVKAVHAYFGQLVQNLPESFGIFGNLLTRPFPSR